MYIAKQRESVYDWRQIGLGIFGLADLLIKLGIKYQMLMMIKKRKLFQEDIL